MKEIFLLRHGDTGYADRYIGVTDAPLSPSGLKEISEIKDFLKYYSFDSVICSPLLRCRQTCENLNLEQTINIDERIREINFGRWEKKTFQEIEKSDPELVRQWANPEIAFEFPEGESTHDFIKRIEFFSEYVNALTGNRFLVVTHGGVIRYLICSLLNLTYNNYLYFHIKYGRVTVINLHDCGGVMMGMNIGAVHG